MKLSVIIITKNEAHNISACIDSVDFADEIIVVDSASTDTTTAIASAAGARVIETSDWPGFGTQKNRALDSATCDWVLSLDADERVTPELAAEIRSIICQPDAADGYRISRRSWYCGRFMRHGGWSPDYVTRLTKRRAGSFTNDLVHERLVVEGRVGTLKGILLHYSFLDYSQVLKKVDHYSTLSAQQHYVRGKQASVGKAVLHGLWAFIRTYLLKLGFLDGAHGLALAVSNAEGSYYRYVKLWLLNEQARGTRAEK